MSQGYYYPIKDSRCDKHGISFAVGGDSFLIFEAKANLTGYTGYYGNSSCGTLTSIRKESAQRLLTAALNQHMETILNTMADLAEKEAAKLKTQAQQEIDGLIEMLESVV